MPDPAVGRADEKLLPAHGTTPHRWIMPQMWMWMDGCCRRGRPASRSMCVMQGNATVARGVVWCPAGSFVPLWPPVRPRLFPGRRAASALLFFLFRRPAPVPVSPYGRRAHVTTPFVYAFHPLHGGTATRGSIPSGPGPVFYIYCIFTFIIRSCLVPKRFRIFVL